MAPASSELWGAMTEHRAFLHASGLLEQRRQERMRRELRRIVATRLDARARALCSGTTYEELEGEVLARSLDPWTAADQLLGGVGA